MLDTLYWSAVLVKGLPDIDCRIAFRSDCRIASNCRRSCRIAGASWPCFCSNSFSSFFTQSSFVTAITYMLRASSLNLRSRQEYQLDAVNVFEKALLQTVRTVVVGVLPSVV